MLDAQDEDLGASNPLPLNAPDAAVGPGLMLALGKDRKAYLLDRNNLGGIGGQLATDTRPMKCFQRGGVLSEPETATLC
jgi:hypothetical protein